MRKIGLVVAPCMFIWMVAVATAQPSPTVMATATAAPAASAPLGLPASVWSRIGDWLFPWLLGALGGAAVQGLNGRRDRRRRHNALIASVCSELDTITACVDANQRVLVEYEKHPHEPLGPIVPLDFSSLRNLITDPEVEVPKSLLVSGYDLMVDLMRHNTLARRIETQRGMGISDESWSDARTLRADIRGFGGQRASGRESVETWMAIDEVRSELHAAFGCPRSAIGDEDEGGEQEDGPQHPERPGEREGSATCPPVLEPEQGDPASQEQAERDGEADGQEHREQ